MRKENLVYVKLEYDEAVQSKRNILASQAGLLKIMKIIRHYHLLRLEELKTKAKIHRRLKELITKINKIKTNLPVVKIPQLKKSEEREDFRKKIGGIRESDYDNNLEIQLQEIQRKLKSIGG